MGATLQFADSCPGIDGLTPHFFTSLWDTIKEDLLHAYEEIITSGNMLEEFGQGMIHLILKSGANANNISKWRPITILNTVYKLLATIMARRLSILTMFVELMIREGEFGDVSGSR